MEELKGTPELVSGWAPALGEPWGPRKALLLPMLLLWRNLLSPSQLLCTIEMLCPPLCLSAWF